ncbi:MAG: hypothetical protein ACOVQT_12125 [Rubrivivax sp.]
MRHRGLQFGHAGQGLQPRQHRQRHAPRHDEDIGEAAFAVEVVARGGQRVHRRQRGDVARDAAAHHQRDGQRLAPELPQVAQQLGVQGLQHDIRHDVHHDSSDGEMRRAL